MKPALTAIASLVLLSMLLMLGMQHLAGAGLMAARSSLAFTSTAGRMGTSGSPQSSSPGGGCASFDAGPTFLFVVGLEGTGHELFSAVAKESPSMQRLADLGGTRKLTTLQDLLYANGGLFTSHCPGRLSMPYNRSSPAAQCGARDSVCLHQEVVLTLTQIVRQLGRKENVVIPVNANGYGPKSHATYPFNQNLCRTLEYPILEYWYQACEEAGVKCGHLYLHRSPYNVLWEAIELPKEALATLQLFTTMLKVIHELFLTHPHSSWGCLNLHEYEDGDHTHNSSATGAGPGPPAILGDLLGFPDASSFRRVWDEVYRPPKSNNKLIPAPFEMYTENFYRTHDMVLQLCRQQSAARAAERRRCSAHKQSP